MTHSRARVLGHHLGGASSSRVAAPHSGSSTNCAAVHVPSGSVTTFGAVSLPPIDSAAIAPVAHSRRRARVGWRVAALVGQRDLHGNRPRIEDRSLSAALRWVGAPRERRDPDHADDRGDQHRSPRALERRARPQVRGVGDDLVGDPEPGLAVGLAQRGRPEEVLTSSRLPAPPSRDARRSISLRNWASLTMSSNVISTGRRTRSASPTTAAIAPMVSTIPTIAATARAVSSSNERSPIEESCVPATSNAPTPAKIVIRYFARSR